MTTLLNPLAARSSILPRRIAVFATLLALVALPTPLGRAADDEPRWDEERWYVVEMQGSKVGWMRIAEAVEDGVLSSVTELDLKLARGAVVIPISIKTTSTERVGGEPISMASVQQIGAMPVSTKYNFREDGMIEITTSQMGAERTDVVEAPADEWMAPGAAARFIQERLEAGDEEFEVTTLDPAVGVQPVVAEYRVLDRLKFEALGKTVPAIKVEATQSYMPGVTLIEYRGLDGLPIRSETSMGGLSLVTIASEKEVALSDLEPAEIMVSTFVEPARPIDAPRQTTRGTYVLRSTGGEMPDLPEGGVQRVTRLSPSEARVEIDLENPRPADRADRREPEYTESSSMIDAEDPAVAALAAEALRGAPDDPARRAEILRRFVHSHIDSKTLGVGYASASEVCRTQEGDCTEHGVLLAALLRADGIPSRVVNGLLYVDQFVGARDVFGYHMWTQALLEADGEWRWVDLDATLPDFVPMDATHIALARSSLARGEVVNSLATLAPLIGGLEIEVETVEHGMKPAEMTID